MSYFFSVLGLNNLKTSLLAAVCDSFRGTQERRQHEV